MDIHEKYKDVPHFENIVEKGTLNIPSVFVFKGGCMELFPFLAACREFNCTVFFENENITVLPENDNFDNMVLSIYAAIAQNPKIAEDYIRYLSHYDDMQMNWVKGVHEAILKGQD